ncbi:M14 family metallopeptidase [Namhaeicola litoreus]|uniref:M14 metallopeptidase family protein n=1 Tax=Namhaeicola litoreus TaxID=1052145 RepID=A0ABW3Y2K4_9FLAO
MKYLLTLLTIFIICNSSAQINSDVFYKEYDQYHEKTIKNRRFKHSDIQPLLSSLEKENGFSLKKLGESIEGRSISMVSVGTGKTTVLLWSQMHGDESTATMALFDIFNYLKSNKELLSKLNLHFIPMLNPDGAEKFTRRNALGVDINRDALRLQSPESRILKNTRDSLNAVFGFNLHDQSKYYNAERTEKAATISFLAPAYNYEKTINDVRGNAMKVIVEMNKVLQKYAPGQVGRYDDSFEPRAFGDNIQKWGTSAILIESGGYQNDPEKQFIRKLNYVSILSALQSIANGSYQKADLKEYGKIPENDRKLFDLKVEKVNFNLLGENYTVDLGFMHNERANKEETEFYYSGTIVEVGDLSTYYGYQTIDAENLEFKLGETYPKILNSASELDNLNFEELLKKGYTNVAMSEIPSSDKFTFYPVNIVDVNKVAILKNSKQPESQLKIGKNPSFVLMKNNVVKYAIVNGFVFDLEKGVNGIKNGVVNP